MTLKSKQRIIFGIVVTLLVWPLVHHALVVRYNIDKWSFLGFSMYITKRPIQVNGDLTLYDVDGVEVTSGEVDQEQYQAVERAILDSTRQRIAYGDLYDSKRLARDIFQASDTIHRFVFEFDLLEMNRETAIFEGVRIRYEAERADDHGNVRVTESSRELKSPQGRHDRGPAVQSKLAPDGTRESRRAA